MKISYGKRKRLKVGEFQVSDNVSVIIPKKDRSKVELRRIPAVIVQVKGSTTHPLYRLACKFGTIEGLFTASNLKSYPGDVELEENVVNNYISLRTAAKLYAKRKDDIFICKCKKGCVNSRCPCKRVNAVCTSRCHKGFPCPNKHEVAEKVDHQIKFPPYGGALVQGDITLKFLNTCPIDDWLVMLRAIFIRFPDIYESLMIECAEKDNILQVFQLIKSESFMLAKLEMSILNRLKLNENCYDFFGTEKNVF